LQENDQAEGEQADQVGSRDLGQEVPVDDLHAPDYTFGNGLNADISGRPAGSACSIMGFGEIDERMKRFGTSVSGARRRR
jgi:hypothetical protein